MSQTLKRGISLVVSVILIPVAVAWGPTTAHATCSQGTGSFSDGGYATPGTWYYYDVIIGPPNSYGDLWVNRNNNGWEMTPNWIHTDGSGYARKGPWTPIYDEYAVAYIRWPNGCTTNLSVHVNDV